MSTMKFIYSGFVAALLNCNLSTAHAQIGMDQININGQFVLAAKAGHVERASALLTQGAKVDSRDRNGDSPLNMAAAKGNISLANVLLNAGADVNLANVAGVTPLMGAAFSGNVEIIRKLLVAGAKSEPLDRVKKNAATYAAGSGCTACLLELIQAGTVVNAALENNLTLLMWAAAYGHESSVQMLLDHGADRKLKDLRGKTAADMAREGSHQNVINLLQQQ